MKPNQVLKWLSALPPTQDTSIECGAGNAEIAQFLSSRYTHSWAVDINPIPVPETRSVRTICADAGHLPFGDRSVDLVVSMQALHHFDVPKHLLEARRVLRPGGIFAALCWGEVVLPTDIRRAYAPTFDAIAPYWEAERPFVNSGYGGIRFEGVSINLPSACMHTKSNLDRLEEFMATWSAVQGAIHAGVDFPDPDIAAFGVADDAEFDISWPLIGQIFRVPD